MKCSVLHQIKYLVGLISYVLRGIVLKEKVKVNFDCMLFMITEIWDEMHSYI